MNRTIEKIICLPLNIITLGCFYFLIIDIHHSQTDDFCHIAVKSNYADFKKAFEKIDWKLSGEFKASLFTNDHKSTFHAGIIRINNIGYKLTTYGYLKAVALKNKKIKEIQESIIK